ncbi:MAG: Holliday junction branch migration protein RuvA [Cyclobacteriaceae bacterium]|nr:Holliday junction branch migration protein RuvA [Cyclobacteriaceae bacterium]
MISFIKGTLVQKDPTHVVVDVNGIGYHVNISVQTYADIKDKASTLIHTHLAIREDAHVLYGFSTETEKKLFQQLITVNGVGPSTAIVMLSYMSADELRQAIAREDDQALQRIKGIGGKTAQRVIIELKDKIRKELHEDAQQPISGIGHNTMRSEALSALITLGITRSAAEKSVDAVLKRSGNTITLEDLVKQALKNA